jgi:hypothetical protein
VFLLGAARVVPVTGPCQPQDLGSASEKFGRELTKALYVRCANMREDAFDFRVLFRAINIGNTALGITAYNGGLFADEPDLDRLAVPGQVCRYFQDLASYDYRAQVK